MLRNALCLATVWILALGCGDSPAPPHGLTWSNSVSRVHTDKVFVSTSDGIKVQNRPFFRDSHGRYVHFHGTNLSGSIKWPTTEDFPSIGTGPHYRDKPFPLADADKHFSQLQRLGFNAVRFLISWEALQPDGPDQFDDEYIEFIDQLIARAGKYGIYVLIDMHQDIFSRHLYTYYNRHPLDANGKEYPRGGLESQIMSLVPPYDDWVRGDGAPRWVVQTCLPEKRMDSPAWGVPRLLYNMGPSELLAIADVISLFMGGDGNLDFEVPEWVEVLFNSLPDPTALPPDYQPYDVRQSNDFLPFTFWGINGALSVDVQRCFACLLAGDKVTPNYKVKGLSVKDYLQDQYARAFARVAEKARHHDNVIGYDIMNEPIGTFITYAAVAVYFQTGLESAVESLLVDLVGDDLGKNLYTILTGLRFLPPDTDEETRKLWGFDGTDAFAVINLNLNFDAIFLQPFYERVGKAIQEVDDNAIIWFETSSGLSLLLGEGNDQWTVNMTEPRGINQAVYAPHWYPDIYPFIGFNQPPREFGPNEWRFRDFTGNLEVFANRALKSMNNIPVVFGEFGTYFNYRGIDASIADGYNSSAQILDAYYRAFEKLNLSRLHWCVSPENSYDNGEGWNLEDFSVIDPDLKPRATVAFVRPYARSTSGKMITSHFYSPLHPQDPEKGEPLPVGEYYLEMEGKETDAPTEIFVPDRQYPKGFYVWLSDGYSYFDNQRQLLTWYPVNDAPGTTHTIRILPPRPKADVHDWDYFFDGDRVLARTGGAQ
jgi:hypothetical protein